MRARFWQVVLLVAVACNSDIYKGAGDLQNFVPIDMRSDLARPDLTFLPDLFLPDLPPKPTDMKPPVADLVKFFTCCGRPGDTGNSLGVGLFCDTSTQCNGNGQSTICATLGDPNQHFCTFLCNGTFDDCGENAACVCTGFGCGCVPDSCVMSRPDGC